MLGLAALATWTAPVAPALAVRAAFACLSRADQRLLAALLFDGERCDALASRLGLAAEDLRERVHAAMHALHRALHRALLLATPPTAMSSALTLRALDALDANEAAQIDAVIAHQPSARRLYEEYCDLVGELCSVVPHVAPAPHVRARLALAIDDDAAN
jgi:hypothetical protein